MISLIDSKWDAIFTYKVENFVQKAEKKNLVTLIEKYRAISIEVKRVDLMNEIIFLKDVCCAA